jgi:3-oxoacyl-[acyl-carrier protein] reductase
LIGSAKRCDQVAINSDLNLADSDFAAQVKMTASDRYEQSDEVAGRVSYLVSSEAAFVTGTSLKIDGGYDA